MTDTPIEALLEAPGAIRVDPANIDAVLAGDGVLALLFAGVNVDRPGGYDVAVALREMLRLYPGSLRVGVVDDKAEMKLKGRFRVIVLPSLVLLHRGEVLEVVPRVRDWSDYADAFARYLGRPRTVAA